MKLFASETISLPSVTNFRDPAAQTTGQASFWQKIDRKVNNAGNSREGKSPFIHIKKNVGRVAKGSFRFLLAFSLQGKLSAALR